MEGVGSIRGRNNDNSFLTSEPRLGHNFDNNGQNQESDHGSGREKIPLQDVCINTSRRPVSYHEKLKRPYLAGLVDPTGQLVLRSTSRASEAANMAGLVDGMVN